jgi:hypothetical protein
MRVNNGLTPQDLKAYGINDVQDIVHNPDYDTLYQEELDPTLEGYERGVLTDLGSPSIPVFLPVVRRKISISFVTIPPAIPCGGLIKAKVKTTTNRSLRKPGST